MGQIHWPLVHLWLSLLWHGLHPHIHPRGKAIASLISAILNCSSVEVEVDRDFHRRTCYIEEEGCFVGGGLDGTEVSGSVVWLV